MKIWIDADAAPREVKELVFKSGARLQLQVILVANQTIWVPPNKLFSAVTVSEGANEADKYMVEKAEAGDLAITADIPLAAQLVAKSVLVINPRGEEYVDRNMAGILAARDLLDAARGAGMDLGGPPPYSPKDRHAFASSLDRILTRALKQQ